MIERWWEVHRLYMGFDREVDEMSSIGTLTLVAHKERVTRKRLRV